MQIKSKGFGTVSRIPVFADALKASWKAEKDTIISGGAIYYPYIMMQPNKKIGD